MASLNNISEILIDPRFQISYSSYYVWGFQTLFPCKIHFSCLSGLRPKDFEDFHCGFGLNLLYEDGSLKKVFVDTSDHNKINEDFYEWSDCYAKINVKRCDLSRTKLLLLGPSFGIRLWNPLKTIYLAFKNYLIARKGVGYLPSFKLYFKDYLYTIVRRLPFSYYNNDSAEDEDYVFTLNTLWYDPLTDSLTNKYRGAFIKICKSVFPKFEGGFRAIDSPVVIEQFHEYKKYYSEYADVITKQRVGLKEYLKKTKRSSLVFNVPSVSGCHGWKIGEYLAMGKVIISTPLLNVIPDEDFFKECVYTVNNEEDIIKAVEYLRYSESQRSKLRQNAVLYFKKYLSPENSVYRIINNNILKSSEE